MTKPKPLICKAAYTSAGLILCGKQGGEPCAHVEFRRCRGWWEQSHGAASCPENPDVKPPEPAQTAQKPKRKGAKNAEH